MKGEIIQDDRGHQFLQVEGGGSWSDYSIDDALKDDNFWKKEAELAKLLYAARYYLSIRQDGEISSEDALKADVGLLAEWMTGKPYGIFRLRKLLLKPIQQKPVITIYIGEEQ